MTRKGRYRKRPHALEHSPSFVELCSLSCFPRPLQPIETTPRLIHIGAPIKNTPHFRERGHSPSERVTVYMTLVQVFSLFAAADAQIRCGMPGFQPYTRGFGEARTSLTRTAPDALVQPSIHPQHQNLISDIGLFSSQFKARSDRTSLKHLWRYQLSA